MDDILITERTREEHLFRLNNVSLLLLEVGFKISLNKCNFFTTEISYLGCLIKKDGLQPAKNKVRAIIEAPKPRNVTQLKSFHGLINYYGQCVENLSSILNPLYELLKKMSKGNGLLNVTHLLKILNQFQLRPPF